MPPGLLSFSDPTDLSPPHHLIFSTLKIKAKRNSNKVISGFGMSLIGIIVCFMLSWVCTSKKIYKYLKKVGFCEDSWKSTKIEWNCVHRFSLCYKLHCQVTTNYTLYSRPLSHTLHFHTHHSLWLEEILSSLSRIFNPFWNGFAEGWKASAAELTN